MATQPLPSADLSLGSDQPPNDTNKADNDTSTKVGISADQEVQGYLKAPTTPDAIKEDLKILPDVLATQPLPLAEVSPGDEPPNDTNKADNDTCTKVGISAAQEIQGYLKAPTTREAIKGDLKILSDVLTSIEQDFNDVTTSVIGLDAKKILSVPFASDWTELHDKYTELMNASQGIAADISNQIEIFLTVKVKILRNEKAPLENKRNCLSKYIEILRSFTDTAGLNSTKFLRLRQSVMRFKKKLIDEVKKGELVDQQLEDIEKKIDQIVSSLQASLGIVEKFCEDARKCLFTVFGEIEGINSLVDMAPTVGKTIMEIMLRNLSSELANVVKDGQRDLKDEQAKLLQSQLQAMKEESQGMRKEFAEVVIEVEKLGLVMDRLNGRLSGIEQIWKLLRTDAGALLSKLTGMKEADDNLEFNLYLDTVEAVYLGLKDSLDNFALAVPK